MSLAWLLFMLMYSAAGTTFVASLEWRLAPGVEAVTRGSVTTVTFTEACEMPVTVCASRPFSRRKGGLSKFRVKLPVKSQRTAIGFQFGNTPASTYLTPSYSPQLKQYISFGGAGYIYPDTKSATRGYKESDEVEFTIDWSLLKVAIEVNVRERATLAFAK